MIWRSAFFQDAFGLVTFDRGFAQMETVAPRTGRNQVIHCLDAYQFGRGLEPMVRFEHVGHSLAGIMRRTSLVAVISDFLFDDVDDTLAELAHLKGRHDLFLVMVDAAAAFTLPNAGAWWVQLQDVETGRHQLVSRRGVRRLAERAKAWQDTVAQHAARQQLDLVRIGTDWDHAAAVLAAFTAERRQIGRAHV